MEKKIKGENIENNLVICISKSICNQINTDQDLFFEIRHIGTKFAYFLFRL